MRLDGRGFGLRFGIADKACKQSSLSFGGQYGETVLDGFGAKAALAFPTLALGHEPDVSVSGRKSRHPG